MAGQNDITGDVLMSKIGNREAFECNFDAIFGKKDTQKCDRCFSCDCEKTGPVFRYSHGSGGIKPESITVEITE